MSKITKSILEKMKPTLENMPGREVLVLRGEEVHVVKEALEKQKRYEEQWLTQEGMSDPLEPIKLSSALESRVRVLQYRLANDSKRVSVLDYTIIAALKKCLDEVEE